MDINDKLDAAEALVNWFDSQGMSAPDASDVMAIVLAAIISQAAANTPERAHCVQVLAQQVSKLLHASERSKQ